MVEYGLMVALIAVVCILVVAAAFGAYVEQDLRQSAAGSRQGQRRRRRPGDPGPLVGATDHIGGGGSLLFLGLPSPRCGVG